MNPVFSVVMPVYNVEDYVAEAICSVLDQSYPNFELLIIDDGGSDSSLDICRLFKDERIRIISQENRGLAGARNTGIRHARGEFVAFLDSDDIWMDRKLEIHLAQFNQCPSLGVAYAPSRLIDENGAPIGVVQRPKIDDVAAKDVFLRNPIGNGSAPVIRRTVLDEIEFDGGDGEAWWFDETFRQSEDIECWMRIALTTNWGFGGVEDILTSYRVSNGGLSAQLTQQFATWRRMTEKVRELDQEFYARWGRVSEAFQRRYLARRAIQMRQPKKAMELALRALICDFAILIREPKKTLTTLGAAFAINALPRGAYEKLETMMIAKI